MGWCAGFVSYGYSTRVRARNLIQLVDPSLLTGRVSSFPFYVDLISIHEENPFVINCS